MVLTTCLTLPRVPRFLRISAALARRALARSFYAVRGFRKCSQPLDRDSLCAPHTNPLLDPDKGAANFRRGSVARMGKAQAPALARSSKANTLRARELHSLHLRRAISETWRVRRTRRWHFLHSTPEIFPPFSLIVGSRPGTREHAPHPEWYIQCWHLGQPSWLGSAARLAQRMPAPGG